MVKALHISLKIYPIKSSGGAKTGGHWWGFSKALNIDFSKSRVRTIWMRQFHLKYSDNIDVYYCTYTEDPAAWLLQAHNTISK